MTDANRLKATVYVAGLDSAVNESILADAFVPFGEIVDVTIPRAEATHQRNGGDSKPATGHRGFGYVEFEATADAKEAIDNMDQSELFGRLLKVAPAKPQKDSSQGLGAKTAIWEQEGYLAKHAVKDEERLEAGAGKQDINEKDAQDPMQELEGLDVAGPRPA